MIIINKYYNKIHSKGLSKRKKIKIAKEFIESINSNPLGALLLNIAVINELKEKQKSDNNGKKESD